MFTPYLSSLYVKSSKKTKSATTSTKNCTFLGFRRTMCSLVSSSRSGTGKWVLLKIFLLCAWDMAICMRSCSKKLKMTSFFFPAMTTQVMVALYKNKPFDSSWILICANIYISIYITLRILFGKSRHWS